MNLKNHLVIYNGPMNIQNENMLAIVAKSKSDEIITNNKK